MALRFDSGTLGTAQRTPQGGLRAPAVFTRVGVLTYRDAKGRQWGELRPPEEVFAPESMATLRGAPVTVGHQGNVDTSNFTAVSKGTVADDVRADGQLLAGEVIVNDAETLAAIEAHGLEDISLGYACKLEETPGTWQGQPYERIQRQIRYNHAALLPPGAGRAGPECSLRLDGAAYEVSDPEPPKDTMKTITFRGRVYRCDSAEDMAALQTAVDTTPKADATPPPADAPPADPMGAKLDQILAMLQKLAGAEAAEGEMPATDPAGVPSEQVLDGLVETRISLLKDAAEILGDVALKGKSTADVQRLVLAKIAPAERLDAAEAKVVEATYRGAMAGWRATQVASAQTARADADKALANIFAPPAEPRQDGKTPKAETLAERMTRAGREPLNPTAAGGKAT